MSASGSRVTDEINLDEFERRLRAAGAQSARAEDPLAELSRLVEFSNMGISNGETAPKRASEPALAPGPARKTLPTIETATLRPTLDDEVEELAPGASEADRAARRDYEFDARHSGGSAADAAEERRPMRWKIAVSALALAGVAMIGAVFALRHGGAGFSKAAPFIAAAEGPTKVAPPTDQTVTTPSDAGATLLKGDAKSGPVKVVNSEEQPVDLNAQASVNNPSAPANTSAGTTDAAALAATINTPLVAPPAAGPPQGMNSEFPDPKPVRTISLRPDGTPIASAPALDQPASEAPAATAPPAAAPSQPAEVQTKPAPKTTSDAGVAQPSTPKIELPTKLSPPKSAARVAVGKTDTTAPAGTTQAAGEPAQTEPVPAKPEKTAKKPKAAQVADANETTGSITQPPVDATAATTSGGWSVQLGAPKSEAEAQSAMTKLNSKYAAELNGSAIGVHKAQVNGETIYRLRVIGLTKADAAAMCAKLKGEGGQCFIAK
jgi:cell division septation protein DedD